MQQNLFQVIIAIAALPFLGLAIWRIRLKRLASYCSPLLGKIEVLQKYNGEKVLTTNSYPQGVSTEQESITQSYWYIVASEASKFCRNRKSPQILTLGLGANTIPNLLAKLDPEINQTIVEIDEQIIEACRKFFGLDNLPNSKLIQADAFSFDFAQDGPKNRFDVIIVDIFLGAPPYVSIDSNRPSFIEKLLPSLKKDGLIIFNRPGHTENVRADSKKLETYLQTLFKKTRMFDVKDPRGFRNTVITAQILKPH